MTRLEKSRCKSINNRKSKLSQPQISKPKLRKINKTNIIPFSPILEEENYDNVIVKTWEEDSKGEVSGPSYIDAVKFASVYNTQTDTKSSPVVDAHMIKAKMNRINAYRDRLKRKSEILSRNKKEKCGVKKGSSKAESGIAGSSTRESQS